MTYILIKLLCDRKKERAPASRSWGHLGRLYNSRIRYKKEFVSLWSGVKDVRPGSERGAFLVLGTEGSHKDRHRVRWGEQGEESLKSPAGARPPDALRAN